MKYSQRSMQSTFRIPPTQIMSGFDDQLLIFARSWSEPESVQLIADEIKQYLSATQADLEVTTPFSFLEGYSALSNRLRIATLLANDRLFKVQNKEFYSAGLEVALFYQQKNEIAWACFGNFELHAHISNHQGILNQNEHQDGQSEVVLLHAQQEIIDGRHILPGHLLGVERLPSVSIGSIQKFLVDQITVISPFCFGEAKWQAEVSGF